MKELLKNAWIGWHDFTDAGKMAALLLISLMILWIYYKRVEQKTFLIYTTIACSCCVIPVTAAWLMLYQTKFYDYEWTWSFVPMTAMIGFAVTLLVMDFLKEAAVGNRKKELAATAGVLIILLFCGGMGMSPWDSQTEQAERESAGTVVSQIRERLADKQIFLWAPREILEYAREYDAGIKLLYGRNMWEDSLNAYVYGGYPQELVELYEWMEGAEEELISVQDCAEILRSTDINCILLSEGMEEEAVRYFEESLGMSKENLGDYYLLIR